MSSPYREFPHWVGLWTGTGEAQAGIPVIVRMTVTGELEETALGFHFEAYDPKVQTLYHGVRAILTAAPNGNQRANVCSTIHGVMLLERTPDDEGVIALTGESAAGNRISVTMVEEGADEMLFAAFWRAAGESLEAEDAPGMSVPLKRVRAWKPPIP